MWVCGLFCKCCKRKSVCIFPRGSEPAGVISLKGCIINFTNLILVSGMVVLFTLALLYLDLGNTIANVSDLSSCNLSKPWLSVTNEIIRPTGVGRMAALVAIISVGGLMSGHWRLLWVPILLAALMLLMTSAARTAIVGFSVSGGLVILLHLGRKLSLVVLSEEGGGGKTLGSNLAIHASGSP